MPPEKDEIVIRLNVIANLLLDLCVSKELKTNAKEKIKLLSEMGLSSGDISRIIGKEPNYVTANLSSLKRRK